ncbi:hypothetical protein BJ508DRAFT_304967 [Ascobolus immersus RN42]|uniref:Uncharacterized protein n=1 Tax=Ascobolus immersus RN42 TaxID=1160509 RepID=A0A3N4INR6_ASCIM|nr:hypothetical protein BJ508DRAFT_304967 [Ascobolus immersus RN42]
MPSQTPRNPQMDPIEILRFNPKARRLWIEFVKLSADVAIIDDNLAFVDEEVHRIAAKNGIKEPFVQKEIPRSVPKPKNPIAALKSQVEGHLGVKAAQRREEARLRAEKDREEEAAFGGWPLTLPPQFAIDTNGHAYVVPGTEIRNKPTEADVQQFYDADFPPAMFGGNKHVETGPNGDDFLMSGALPVFDFDFDFPRPPFSQDVAPKIVASLPKHTVAECQPALKENIRPGCKRARVEDAEEEPIGTAARGHIGKKRRASPVKKTATPAPPSRSNRSSARRRSDSVNSQSPRKRNNHGLALDAFINGDFSNPVHTSSLHNPSLPHYPDSPIQHHAQAICGSDGWMGHPGAYGMSGQSMLVPAQGARFTPEAQDAEVLHPPAPQEIPEEVIDPLLFFQESDSLQASVSENPLVSALGGVATADYPADAITAQLLEETEAMVAAEALTALHSDGWAARDC